ncbi:MAG: hypothetical protein ACR2F8_09850 [Caulobacteraceae bacterium]
MNWNISCSGAPGAKSRFHRAARVRLRQLALALRFAPASYDLRSNLGGMAGSGEITLHHDALYIQVSQSAMGGDMGVLIRTCRGRRDYTGGQNNFVPLSMLDDIPALATRVRAITGSNAGSSPPQAPACPSSRLHGR